MYIPLACAACWLTALLAMMGLWVAAGKPRYTDDEPSTVFISNVAGKHKVSSIGIYMACTLSTPNENPGPPAATGCRWISWFSSRTRQSRLEHGPHALRLISASTI